MIKTREEWLENKLPLSQMGKLLATIPKLRKLRPEQVRGPESDTQPEGGNSGTGLHNLTLFQGSSAAPPPLCAPRGKEVHPELIYARNETYLTLNTSKVWTATL